MSASSSKADMRDAKTKVRYGPIAEIIRAATATALATLTGLLFLGCGMRGDLTSIDATRLFNEALTKRLRLV